MDLHTQRLRSGRVFEKDGLIEDTIEEFIIELGEFDSDDDDKDNRQLIGEALQK